MKGLEPSTFCMASRRSSQLSYIREGAQYSRGSDGLLPTRPRFTGRGWLPSGTHKCTDAFHVLETSGDASVQLPTPGFAWRSIFALSPLNRPATTFPE
jgi:hypothetical protein